MKHKSFIAGFVSGAILFGCTGAYAAGILAVPSEQEIFVNGKKLFFLDSESLKRQAICSNVHFSKISWKI